MTVLLVIIWVGALANAVAWLLAVFTGLDPTWAPPLNTALLIVLAIVQLKVRRQARRAEDKATVVEQKVKTLENDGNGGE